MSNHEYLKGTCGICFKFSITHTLVIFAEIWFQTLKWPQKINVYAFVLPVNHSQFSFTSFPTVGILFISKDKSPAFWHHHQKWCESKHGCQGHNILSWTTRKHYSSLVWKWKQQKSLLLVLMKISIYIYLRP